MHLIFLRNDSKYESVFLYMGRRLPLLRSFDELEPSCLPFLLGKPKFSYITEHTCKDSSYDFIPISPIVSYALG